ncbi:sigma factor-like helix-turn-helix DNA-binding protein [Microbacterium sp. ProA8]|uniref:sigma factor-like helix-turn-helix DNA-binding protein n=1 Tax=Microbacterium chionoecetis TaxID=3153754 RepID=UPI0032657573
MNDETGQVLAHHIDGGADIDPLDESLRVLLLRDRLQGIPDRLDLGRVRMGVRMRNILSREGLGSYGEIKLMSVNDLLALRGAGVGSVRELLEGLMTATGSPPAPEVAAMDAAPEPRWKADVVEDLETLARWHRILGSEDVSVLTAPDGVVEPAAVASARARIAALAASDLLPDVEDGGAAAAAVEAALAGPGDRELTVLRDRVMADDPVSLDDLGKQFEVTRERIRQIESKLIAILTERTRAGDLHSLATIASGAIGSLVGLRTLVQRHPTLGEHVSAIGQPVWRFLDRIDLSYEIKDGWCARGTVAGAVAQTKSELTRLAAGRSFVELAAVDSPGLELSTEWLEYCGVTLLRGCALLGRAGMPDRAEVILHTQQEPMSSEALVAGLGVDRSVRSLRNQLSEDPRFSRVDRDDWGLASWGLTGYLGIRAMIGRSLTTAGGEMTIDDLVADITSRFDVSPRSIVTYATSFPYITLKGVVRRRARRDMRRPRRKGLAQTRGLYRHDDSVKLRFVVNSEHLRGSGSPLPNALGEEIDLSVAEAKTLVRTGVEGTILVSWRGPQIVLGSVRAEIEKLGLREGDLAFFVFGTDGTFGVEPVQESNSTEARILALTGDARSDDADVWATLADRIDSAAGERDAVLAALSARGDAQIVEIAGTQEAYPAVQRSPTERVGEDQTAMSGSP